MFFPIQDGILHDFLARPQKRGVTELPILPFLTSHRKTTSMPGWNGSLCGAEYGIDPGQALTSGSTKVLTPHSTARIFLLKMGDSLGFYKHW